MGKFIFFLHFYFEILFHPNHDFLKKHIFFYSKSRYMDSHSHSTGNSNGDSRYSDRTSSAWPSTGPPAVKPFGHIQSVAGNDPWGQKQSESSWRALEQGQDRYDRTYNERKSSQSQPSQYIEQQPRQNSFIGRPQDRYNSSISSRFENGRF